MIQIIRDSWKTFGGGRALAKDFGRKTRIHRMFAKERFELGYSDMGVACEFCPLS